MANSDIAVRYVSNVDPSDGTTEIRSKTGDTIVLGGDPGYVTEEEYAVLPSYVVVEQVDESDLPPREGEDDLEGLSLSDLKDVADQEDVDVSGLRSKTDVAQAIRDSRGAGAGTNPPPGGSTGSTGPVGGEPGPAGAAGPAGSAGAAAAGTNVTGGTPSGTPGTGATG